MDYVTEHSFDQIGERITPMWLSTIDLRTNGLPEPLMPTSPRWNGTLLSPTGANLYWDQPTILAAFELSKRTGCKCYSESATAYISSFLSECTDSNGNSFIDPRFYYDIKHEKAIDTTATLPPCTPYTPAWETVWAADPDLARRQIEVFIQTQRAEDSLDGLNQKRLAGSNDSDIETPKLTIESETALIASLCWLAQQDSRQKQSLTKSALSLARNRINHRNSRTGLVPTGCNFSDQGNRASSLQIGAWAFALLRAGRSTGETEFQKLAKQALRPWLTLGFNPQQQRYYNQLDCKTGKPATERERSIASDKEIKSAPQQVSIFSHVNRPPYQSPLKMAEACLSLHEASGDFPSRQAVERWANMIQQELSANENQVGYAEDYGRAIHFLVRASEVMKRPTYHTVARDLANEAMASLYVPKMGMFRSHPDENRCDSADGPGFLLLALMYLEGSDPTKQSALQF